MKKTKKQAWSFSPLIFVMAAVILLQALISIAYYSAYPVLSIVQWIIAVAAITVFMTYMGKMKAGMRLFVSKLIKQQPYGSELFGTLSLPVAVFRDLNELIWYNELFRTQILKGKDLYGSDGELILNESARASLEVSGHADVAYNNRFYSVFYGGFSSGKDKGEMLYFIDDTDFKTVLAEYEKSRPVIVLVAIDSLEDLTEGLPESEQAAIRSIIEREVEQWAQQTNGLIRRLNNNRYLLAMDKSSLEEITASRFDVLDKVRSLTFSDRGNATLSIGVGYGGADIRACETMAQQALDMAFGRGGDQAAVKDGTGFEFYGGINNKGTEKRSKVRTRVIAAALRELIDGSDSVFVMGHKYADLDCIGAAFGLWRVITDMKKSCYIVTDKQKTLAKPLVENVIKQAGEHSVIELPEALPLVTKRSLLIIVDVHRAEFLDFPELYKACQTVVVIDHHRKTVDYINDAVIFYHEPYASSACEMVSELLQYFGAESIGKTEANALLAGIMLDTRNFVLRTGVRTFEASAFLRGRGADPVEVKSMFAGSMEIYRERSAIVAAAEIYKNCAISFNDSNDEKTRIASAQAADELLNIENVDAAFVLFKTDNVINISARSMGKVNVQIIMEFLGGGGHHTMAAAQLEDVDEHEARSMLIEAIDRL